MVALPGRAAHRRPVAADARYSWSGPHCAEHPCPERRDRDRRDGRPYLDAALRAPHGLPAGDPFLQALRRSDRPRRICRPRRRHGAHGLCPRRRADLPQRALFPRALRPPLAPAGVAQPRHPLRHPRRAARRQVQLHAADLPSPSRPAHPPDGHVPGDRVMTSPLLWTLIVAQLAMGLFDILYHHEMTERLAWRRSQRRELRLHGARNLAYAALFLVLGLTEPHGVWAMLVIAVLAAELVVTLIDFVEEDVSRKLPASERVTHTLLAINYGALLSLLVPVLVGWAKFPAAVVPVWYGIGGVLAP